MNTIEIDHITKDYGNGKGVFDVSFSVQEGEVLGFLGPNGAGKTTTIRQLMGFIKPDRGSVHIGGMECFSQAAEIQKNLGYLPGEIAFLDEMSGLAFLRFQAGLRSMQDFHRAEELIAFFELDPRGKIRKMSKGMKQKIGIVCAFMHDPAILILDEPTSGLDPLMQNRFVALIQKEKERGKTILMSSHLFDEVERTCDRAAIIRAGRLVAVERLEHLRATQKKTYLLRFDSEESARGFCKKMPEGMASGSVVSIPIQGSPSALLEAAAASDVRDIDIQKPSLEELFLHFYGGKIK